jgi:hypothetical protein
MPTTSVEKFHGLTDLPLYNRPPGWCKTLQNWRVRPGGYLEQRAGFDAIKPSGGTAADPISAGIFTGAHEHTMADGYIFTYETTGGTYSANLAQRGYFEIFSASDDEQHDAIYIGSTIGQFSRVVFFLASGTMGATDPTLAYEYPQTAAWDTDGTAASTGDLTLTSTPNWEATGEQVMEWAIPSDWVKSVRNGIYGWWVRVRIATLNDGFTTAVRQGGTGTAVAPQKVFSDWPGAREIYVASANSAAATNNGTLKYYGQSSSTQVAWNSVSTSLFSGNYPRARFASYRNLLYMVNGKEQKRWDGNTLADLGFTAPDIDTDSATAFAGTGDALGNGVWLYAMTFGYGPNGEWGESAYTQIGTAATTVAGVNDGVRLKWSFATAPSGAVENIYIYRTQNLASAQSSGQAAFPYYRIATIYRQVDGDLQEDDATADYTDETLALPFPPVDLDIATRTPPSRCKFIGVHKNRLFLGGNNQYPGRVWWSQAFQSEAFNTDEDFADFTRSTGGLLSGMLEFGDQMVVFTEDKMFGIANVDQDQPAIYEIASVGCVAPDTIKAGYGSLMWAARDGIYRWTGEGPPENISSDLYALSKLTRETHGGSRAAIHTQCYDIYFITAANAESAFARYRYDFVTNTWSTVLLGTLTRIAPLVTVTAPLGHADEGVRHPLYGAAATGGTDYKAYLGEYTNQDGGNNFTCIAEVLFGPRGDKLFTPKGATANYYAGSGTSFGSTTLDFGGNSGTIGPPATAGTAVNDGSDDYGRFRMNATNRTTGQGDLLVKFTAVTQSGGAATLPARLLALHLDAENKDGGS